MLRASCVDGPAVYRDIRLCGTGATSRVYRAVERATGRAVALKRLNRHLVRTSEALTRFRRELDALRRVHHPGIAKVHEVIDWDGDPTLVMDFIEGVDLHELVTSGGPLPPAVATRVARELFDIMAAAHGAGIVHRDIKPQNVRIGAEGQVILLDFGSARLDAASKLTTTGTTVGTPEYMPPELFAGSVYDPRVDIYGVGATVFYALSGRPPQSAESLAELATLRNNADAPPVASAAPDTPVALAQVVDRCLARDPSLRYAASSLAIWALDHPEHEREWIARRSRHPSCLECQARIPPEAAICPACKSQHPFGYRPGLAHVEITSVSEPRRFIEQVVTEFPELATPAGLQALAERCAALSYDHQRYVSFIDRQQADKIVERLAAHGARAHAVEERGVVKRSALVGLAAATLFYAFSHVEQVLLLGYGSVGRDRLELLPVCFAVGYLAASLASLRRAEAGILGAGRAREAVWPRLRGLSGIAALVAVAWAYLAYCAWQLYRDAGVAGNIGARALGAAIVGAAGLAALLVAAQAARLRAPGRAARQSPEPPLCWKVKRAMLPTRRATELGAEAAPTSVRMVLAACALVLLEVLAVGLASIEMCYGVLPPGSSSRACADGTMHGPFARGTPLASELRREADFAAMYSFARTVRLDEAPRSIAAASACLIVAGLVAVRLRRRRSRISTDASQILSEIDPGAREHAANRSAPRTRELPTHHAPADAVGALVGADGFTRDAVARAADLLQVVEPGSSQRFTTAITAMGARKNQGQVRARSYLARSILETDAGQKARFEFLALEAELEAEAAEEWWQARARR